MQYLFKTSTNRNLAYLTNITHRYIYTKYTAPYYMQATSTSLAHNYFNKCWHQKKLTCICLASNILSLHFPKTTEDGQPIITTTNMCICVAIGYNQYGMHYKGLHVQTFNRIKLTSTYSREAFHLGPL